MLFRLPHRNENSSIGHVKSYISSHKESFVRIFNVMRLSNLLQKRKLNMAMIEPYIKREREREGHALSTYVALNLTLLLSSFLSTGFYC